MRPSSTAPMSSTHCSVPCRRPENWPTNYPAQGIITRLFDSHQGLRRLAVVVHPAFLAGGSLSGLGTSVHPHRRSRRPEARSVRPMIYDCRCRSRQRRPDPAGKRGKFRRQPFTRSLHGLPLSHPGDGHIPGGLARRNKFSRGRPRAVKKAPTSASCAGRLVNAAAVVPSWANGDEGSSRNAENLHFPRTTAQGHLAPSSRKHPINGRVPPTRHTWPLHEARPPPGVLRGRRRASAIS